MSSRPRKRWGDRGIQVAARTVRPDLAIVFEGAPADDTFVPEAEIQTGLGRGVMLRHYDLGMITNPRVHAVTRWTPPATPASRPRRPSAPAAAPTAPRSTFRAKGVPVVVLSVPVRYAHSHHGFSSIEDYENTVRLAVQLLRALDEEVISRF